LTENELNLTATYIIALANTPNAQEKIKLLLTSLLASYQQEGFFHKQKNKQKAVSVQLRFTQQEISKMASTFLLMSSISSVYVPAKLMKKRTARASS
jgi:hypothetical protein